MPINFDPKVITKTQNLNPIVQSNGAFFIFKKKHLCNIIVELVKNLIIMKSVFQSQSKLTLMKI